MTLLFDFLFVLGFWAVVAVVALYVAIGWFAVLDYVHERRTGRPWL